VVQKILQYLKQLKRHSKVALSEQLQQPEHGTAKMFFISFKTLLLLLIFSLRIITGGTNTGKLLNKRIFLLSFIYFG
jgi:hypothetical protein